MDRNGNYFLFLGLLSIFIACSDNGKNKETDHSAGTDSQTDTDSTLPDSDTAAPGEVTYPPMSDGQGYASMLKMLDSLGGLPDYRVSMPSSLSSSLDGNKAEKYNLYRLPFDPDAQPDMMCAKFDEFRQSAVLDEDITFVKGLVDFLKTHLESNIVPQGVVTSLGDKEEIQYSYYGAYQQETRSRWIEPGSFSWMRDDSGEFTLHWRLRRYSPIEGADELGHHEYYMFVGSPLSVEGPESSPLYQYTIYRSQPTMRPSDYNGKGLDRDFWSLSYNEISAEVETYWRAHDLVWSIGREDDLYSISYGYKHIRPDEDSEANGIFVYIERGESIAEIESTTGKILGWYNHETVVEIEEPSRIERFAAYGDDTGAVLLTGPAEFLDENGNLILRRWSTDGKTPGFTLGDYFTYGQNIASPQDATEAPSWVWAYYQSYDPVVVYWIATDEPEAPPFSEEQWHLLESEQSSFYWSPGENWAAGDVLYTWQRSAMAGELLMQGYQATYTVPSPVVWNDRGSWNETDWLLKHLRPSNPEELIEFKEVQRSEDITWWYYYLGDWQLPVFHDYLGRYDQNGNWEVVNIPFFRGVSLSSRLEILPEIQAKIDAQETAFTQLTQGRHFSLERHPFYRFPAQTFEAILTAELDGVWVREAEDDKVDVLLVDSNVGLSRFEYRRYAPVTSQNPDEGVFLEQGASGHFEDICRAPTQNDENVELGWALEFRTTGHYLLESDNWESMGELHAPSVLDIPEFLYTGRVLYHREGQTLTVEHGDWNTPDRPVFVFTREWHDPMLEKLASEPVAPPPSVWTAVTQDGTLVETTFHPQTWQEIHFAVDEERNIQVLRAFRGTHTVDMAAGSGGMRVTMLYDPVTREWVSEEELPDIFEQMVQEDTYLKGLVEWQVRVTLEDDDSMTMTIEEPGPAAGYSYRPQGSGVDLNSCLFNACVTIAASHCEQAIGGPLPGRGMSLPPDQWNNNALPACTDNCFAQSMCAQAQRVAYTIDCTNQFMACSADWTAIDTESCNKIKSLPQINNELQDCRHRCQMDLEVVFPDPEPIIDTLNQCVEKYGAMPSN
jgi:hypothetical protein